MLRRLAEERPRQLLKPSGPEQPDITVGWEALEHCVKEAMPLLAREHAEGKHDGRIPFDPDWDRFLSWSASGALDIWTVRDGPVLVGYASVLFMPHLYSRAVAMANVHAIYLDPQYRQGWLAVDVLKSLLASLKSRSVVNVDIDINIDNRFGAILERLGFRPIETRRRKWL